MARILIADDEPLYRDTTAELLRDEGYECICVEDASDAISQLREQTFDLVLSDLNMPGNQKLELLKIGRGTFAHVKMIVVTGVPSVPSAIESVRLGISDYLLKPVKFEVLLAAIKQALELPSSVPNRGESVADPLDHKIRFPGIIGDSTAIRDVLDIVHRVADSTANVLITGESGTGKEVIARAIHDHSPRHREPFHVIDCTAIPDALFESVLFGHIAGSFTGAVTDQTGQLRHCDRGTAFFDELGELPPTSQAKLLRAVQEQTFTPVGESKPVKVDTRFVCATNRDLQSDVDSGNFRSDLFYRLAVIHIELPPLRLRGNDVLQLANHFLETPRQNRSSVATFSPEVADRFLQYRWPGNIRELRNVVERSITLARGDTIEIDALPAPLRNLANRDANLSDLSEVSRDEAIDSADQAYLNKLLLTHGGVIASAARQAGLSRQGLNKLLKRHKIDVDAFRK